MRCLAGVLMLLVALPAHAQVISRPTDPPIVTAENDSWYRLREPLLFAGDAYYPAGAPVFFNGNTMVRTGHYNGVPLYADTTIEPYSIVFVPIGRGLLQPYERVRRGELAGTSGSRTPSFPGSVTPQTGGIPMAAVAPTALPQPVGAIGAFTAETNAVGTSGRAPAVAAPSRATTAPDVAADPRTQTTSAAPAGAPPSADAIWLRFMNETWVSAGPAVPLRADAFVIVGEYAGFPVFARRELQEERIYLPAADGLVTPFRLKP